MGNKVLDVYSGCGGLSYGFMKAGWDVAGFIEHWQPAIETFRKNHPEAKHIGNDIRDVKEEDLEFYRGMVDIVVGGPPCQGFSMVGKRNPNDKRNQLYREFLRVVRTVDPKMVLIENVTGILSMPDSDGGKVIDRILKGLIRMGYFVSYRVIKASDFGIAQNRERVIILARKLDLFPKPETVHKKTVMDAISDLPYEETELNGHQHLDTKPETLKRIKKLKHGQRLSDKFNFSRQRLYPDRPSKTVVTIPLFIHPLYDRFLTPRELARLQSFPDSFEFCGSKASMVKQVGNAVPPLMAERIAEKIMEFETSGGAS